MTSSAPTTSASARWLLLAGTTWFVLFSLWFYSFTLPNNPQVTRLDILSEVPNLLHADLFPESTPDHGWFVLLERLPPGLMSLATIAAALALGRLALRGLGVCSAMDRIERLALSGGLGLSLFSLLILGLGLAGCLSQLLIIVLLIAIALLELFLTIRDLRSVTATLQAMPSEPAPYWLVWPLAGLIALFVCVMFLGALLPSTDFDVKEYHLEGPKEYFLAGRIHFLPHNVYTSFPFLTEMLSLSGMVLCNDWYWGAIVGKGVLMSFAIWTALGLFALTRRMAGPSAGWMAAALYLTTPWVYRISIIAYTEGALCAYVLLSVLAFDVALRANRNRFKAWLLTGFLAGSAAATKYPGLIFVSIPLGIALFVAYRRQLIAHRHAVLGYAVGVVLAFGPWLLKNVVETGNPVYPLGWSVFGGTDWDAELNAKFKAGHAAPLHLLSDPVALVADLAEKTMDVTSKSDWQSSLIFGFLPLGLFAADRIRMRAIAVYALAFFLMWFLLTHRIDRFWVPLLPLTCILAALGADGLRRAWHYELTEGPLPLPVVACGIAVTAALVLSTQVYQFAFVTSGICGPDTFLTKYDKVQQQAFAFTPLIARLDQMHERAVQQKSPPPKFLLVGEAQVFDLRGEYVYNTVFDYSIFEEWTADPADQSPHGERRLASPEQIREIFEREGITHVAVNWREVLRYRTTYGYTEYVSPGRFDELVDAGILTRISPGPEDYVEVDLLESSWQQSLAAPAESPWGTGLIIRNYGKSMIPAFQVFEVQ